jgi:hypothetical protein
MHDLLPCQAMPVPRIARLVTLGATLLVAGLACSNSTKRDQFYNTDVGANWIPPDATVRESGAAPDGGAGDAGDAGDAGVDAGIDTASPSADAPASDTL